MTSAFKPRPDCPVPVVPAIAGMLVSSCAVEAAPPPIFVFPVFDTPLPNPPGFPFGCYKPSMWVDLKKWTLSDWSSYFSSSSIDFLGGFKVEITYPNSSETGTCEPLFVFRVRFPPAACPDLSAEARIQVQTKSLYATASAEKDQTEDCVFKFKLDLGIPCVEFASPESSVSDVALDRRIEDSAGSDVAFFALKDSEDWPLKRLTPQTLFKFTIELSLLSSSSSQQACRFQPVITAAIPMRPLVWATDAQWPCYGFTPTMPSDARLDGSDYARIFVPSCGPSDAWPRTGDAIWRAGDKKCACFAPVISGVRLRSAYVQSGEAMTLVPPGMDTTDPHIFYEKEFLFEGPGQVMVLDYTRTWLPMCKNIYDAANMAPSSRPVNPSPRILKIGEEFEMPVDLLVTVVESSFCGITGMETINPSTCGRVPGEDILECEDVKFEVRLITEKWMIEGSVSGGGSAEVYARFDDNYLGVNPACCQMATYIQAIDLRMVGNTVVLEMTSNDIVMPMVTGKANPIPGTVALDYSDKFSVVTGMDVKTGQGPGCPGCEYQVLFDVTQFQLPAEPGWAGVSTEAVETINTAPLICCASYSFVEAITGFDIWSEEGQPDTLELDWTTRFFALPTTIWDNWSSDCVLTCDVNKGFKFRAVTGVTVEPNEECKPCGQLANVQLTDFQLLWPPIGDNVSLPLGEPACCTKKIRLVDAETLVLAKNYENCGYHLEFGVWDLRLPKLDISHPTAGIEVVTCTKREAGTYWEFTAVDNVSGPTGNPTCPPCGQIITVDRTAFRVKALDAISPTASKADDVKCCYPIKVVASDDVKFEIDYDLCAYKLSWKYYELRLPKLRRTVHGAVGNASCQNGEITFTAVSDVTLTDDPNCPPCGQVLDVVTGFYYLTMPSASTSINVKKDIQCCEEHYVITDLELVASGRNDEHPILCGYNLKATKRLMVLPRDDFFDTGDPGCEFDEVEVITAVQWADKLYCGCGQDITFTRSCIRPFPATGVDCTVELVCDVQWNEEALEVKRQTLTFAAGLLTDCGTCGEWEAVPSAE